MDKRIQLNYLYDYYKKLLTEKQRYYFEDYYFNNFSLTEISTNFNVSRNAIHKQLKIIETKLYNYEECLQLYKKRLKIKELIIGVDNILREEIERLI